VTIGRQIRAGFSAVLIVKFGNFLICRASQESLLSIVFFSKRRVDHVTLTYAECH